MPDLPFDEFMAQLRAEQKARRQPLTPSPAPAQLRRRAVAARRRAKREAKDTRAIAGIEWLRLDPCAYCSGPATTHDHIEPISKGGTNTLDNLTRCCWRCNRQKGTRSLLVFLATR